MLKRSLFFVNPYHLSVKNRQLQISNKNSGEIKSVPAEDIGFAVFDNKQITYSHSVFQLFSENNTAVIICNEQHLPASIMLNYNAHHMHGKHTDCQINASAALKKNLWKQTIKQKIRNQAEFLQKRGYKTNALFEIAKQVKSGDVDNRESYAASIYWKQMYDGFSRHRYGDEPNSMFNYCYAILRAATAKALTGSGLLPLAGIHHRNKYNAFRLADDIMEPYRPFADALVVETFEKYPDYEELTTEIKAELLNILTADVQFPKVKRPLSVGLSMTTASLAQCFLGEIRKLKYPTFVKN